MKNKILFLCICSFWSAIGWGQGVSAPYQKLPNRFFEQPEPFASEWNPVGATAIRMFPQNITTPSLPAATIAQAEVKSLHNGKWLAILLTWVDGSRDVNISNDHASDACAVQFPVKTMEATSPFMGSKGAPVAILHWKAIWQNDIDDHYQEVKDLHPNTWVDDPVYRFGKNIAMDAKNPVSQQQRSTPVEELIAEGFGTLTTQRQQNAAGKGIWKDGKWHVVLVRRLKSPDRQDPRIKIREPTALAVALWEGGEGNVGGRKNYAPWIAFTLEQKK